MDVEREIAWALSRWSLGVQLGIVFLITVVFFAVWVVTRRRVLRTWALAWAFDALGLGVVLALAVFLADRAPRGGLILYAAYSGFKILYAAFLVLGSHQYRRVPWSMRPGKDPALLAAAAVWVLALLVIRPPVVHVQALTYLVVAGLLVPAGIAGLSDRNGVGERVVGAVLLVQGAAFLHHGLVLVPAFAGGPVPAYMSRISFVDAVVEFLVGLGCVLALGLRILGEIHEANQRLEERERILRTMVETDPLTGLANRRALRAYVAGLDSPGMVLFIDIDRFKEINDAWGHATGDRCLVRVADALRAVFRSGDGLFRVGGDEFLVVVPDLGREAAADRVRRLREILAEGGSDAMALSISVGLAPLDDAHRLDMAMVEADAAMYEDKSRRR